MSVVGHPENVILITMIMDPLLLDNFDHILCICENRSQVLKDMPQRWKTTMKNIKTSPTDGGYTRDGEEKEAGRHGIFVQVPAKAGYQ